MTVWSIDRIKHYMTNVDGIIRLVSDLSKATGLAESTISSKFLDAGGKIAILRRGGDMRARRIEKIVRRFARDWPRDLPWPEGIERPFVDISRGDA